MTDGIANEFQSNNRKNTHRLRNWTIFWLVSSALAAYGPKWIWDFQTALTLLFVLINLGIGFGMILALKKHLLGLDEMQRLIFLDASAIALGVGVVLGLAYELLEDVMLISFQPEISHLVIIMALTFLVGILLGNRKYK